MSAEDMVEADVGAADDRPALEAKRSRGLCLLDAKLSAGDLDADGERLPG